VSTLCRNFGVPFTKKVVKNIFLTEMHDNSEVSNEGTIGVVEKV
jgi:hypothetical protein